MIHYLRDLFHLSHVLVSSRNYFLLDSVIITSGELRQLEWWIRHTRVRLLSRHGSVFLSLKGWKLMGEGISGLEAQPWFPWINVCSGDDILSKNRSKLAPPIGWITQSEESLAQDLTSRKYTYALRTPTVTLRYGEQWTIARGLERQRGSSSPSHY